jgi:hypothetical protein
LSYDERIRFARKNNFKNSIPTELYIVSDMKRIDLNSPKTVILAALLIFAALLILHSGKASAEKKVATTISERQSVESKVFSEFDDWIKRYLDGNFSDKREFIGSGEEIAFKRRELFKELIKTNPQAAIGKAVSENVQARLPVSITQLLEKNISANGDFNVYAVDDFDSAASINQPLEREIVIENVRYKAFVYGRKALMTTKLNVPIRGVALDDSMAVDENSVRKIEPSEYESRKVDASKIAENAVVADAGGKLIYFSGQKDFDKYVSDLKDWESKIAPDKTRSRLSPWTTGDKTMLFIRVDYPDRPGEPIDRFGQTLTASAAQNIIDGQVNDFYYANSYKKTTLRAVVTPVVRMPLPQTAYPRDNLFALVTDARNAALAAGFDTNGYDLDVVAYSYTPLHAFSGISPIGNKGALFNGSFTFKTVTHEIGHEYGLGHANLWRTDDGTPNGNGQNIEYGDDFDMMGRGNTQETHFNASYKRTLDWLTEENVQTVTQNGVYRIFAFDINTPNPQGIRVLKIKKDDVKDYWVDFRQLLTGIPNLMDGALIHWDYPFSFWRQTQLLDMQPDTQTLGDASLLIGQTFQDEKSGIKIKILGKGGTTPESLDIMVEFNYSIINGAPFDFDGDDKTDISIFRPSAGEWWYSRSSDGGNYAAQFGNSADKLVPGDYTGDGRADIAVFRPSNGEWFILRSEDGSYYSYPFGTNGDIPTVGDFDGDGKADSAVFRPSDTTWYIRRSSDGGFTIQQFGAAGDAPAVADYDGDGKSDIAIWRASVGEWWIQRSSNSSVEAFQFGNSSDKPVQGDYTGDGKADVAIYRPTSGEWFILRSEDFSYYSFPFGTNGDVPAAGDYDGDGRFDATVFRPSQSTWYVQRSTAGTLIQSFGQSGDRPVPNAFVP